LINISGQPGVNSKHLILTPKGVSFSSAFPWLIKIDFQMWCQAAAFLPMGPSPSQQDSTNKFQNAYSRKRESSKRRSNSPGNAKSQLAKQPNC